MFVTQVLKPLAPDCVTVTVCPAIVSVPMRSNPVFGCRATLTAPLLEFVADDVTAMKLLLLEAVHVHAGCVVTINEAGPPPAPTVPFVVDSEYVQLCCVTVNICPPIETVPVRARPVALAATLKFTALDPEPVPVELSVMNGALLTAVHEQDDGAFTVVLAIVAASPTVSVAGEIAVAQDDTSEGVDGEEDPHAPASSAVATDKTVVRTYDLVRAAAAIDRSPESVTGFPGQTQHS